MIRPEHRKTWAPAKPVLRGIGPVTLILDTDQMMKK